MKLTGKKKKEINLMLSTAFNQTLLECEGESGFGSRNWFDDPPDTWRDVENEKFTLLSEFQNKVQAGLENIFNQTKSPATGNM